MVMVICFLVTAHSDGMDNGCFGSGSFVDLPASSDAGRWQVDDVLHTPDEVRALEAAWGGGDPVADAFRALAGR